MDLTQCGRAGKNTYPDDDGGGGTTQGGPIVIINEKIGPLPGIEGEPFPENGDGGGGPPTPGMPVIILPNNCFPFPDDPPYTTEIVIKVDPVPIINSRTTTEFIDDDGQVVTEIDLDFTGPLIDEAETQGITGFGATLLNLDSETFDQPTDLRPTLRITLPTSDEALAFYANNESLLNQLRISASTNLLYSVVFGDGSESIAWTRFAINFTVGVSVQIEDVGDPIEPDIQFPIDDALEIVYDVPEDDQIVTEINPTTWDFNDYTLDEVTINVPNALTNAGYEQTNVSMNEGTGTIRAVSTPLTLPEVNESGGVLKITVRLYFLPNAPFSGEQIEVPFQINLNVYDGTITEGPPQYDQVSPKPIITNSPTPEPRTLTPTFWPEGATIDFINIYSFGEERPEPLDSVQYGDPPTAYQWVGFGGTDITHDDSTGEITFNSITTDFNAGALPYQVQVIVNHEETEYIFVFNIVISTQSSEGGPIGGGGGGGNGNGGPVEAFTTLSSPAFGAKISVPSRLFTDQLNLTTNRPRVPAPSFKFPRNFVSVFERPLSSEQQIKKRRVTDYVNGVTSDSFTFVSSKTFTDSILVNIVPPSDFSVTSVSPRNIVLSNNVDETVRGILNINSKQTEINDYVYNALTTDKIFSSLRPEVKDILENSLDVNGQPIKNKVTSIFKNSLVKNQITNFAEEDILDFRKLELNKERIEKNQSKPANRKQAMELLLSRSVSINPDDYRIKTKNRLLNWKSLSEDINKRIIYKTADGVESSIFIPNNDLITVVLSDGTEATLEMQDGDFFHAAPVRGDQRLTVFSDKDKAKVLPFIDSTKAAFLLGEPYNFTLDCTSVTSDLVEFNVDTTGSRQDYYFLRLDKNTIKDAADSSLFTRTTQADYVYTTTGIDDFVKHKAFPYMVFYIRNDDMLLNHLESSNLAKLTFKDFTLDNFTNTPEDTLLVRQLPQHIMIVPSDRTQKVFSQGTSKLVDFNTRRADVSISPFTEDTLNPLKNPFYLSPEITTDESINFGHDVEGNILFTESTKYVFNSDLIDNVYRYKNSVEVLPRQKSAFGKTLEEINTIKTNYGLSNRDSINTFDLITRLDPHIYRSLAFDVLGARKFVSKFRLNTVTDDKVINDTYFVPVKEISNINDETLSFLPTREDTPQVSSKTRTAASKAPDPVPAPTPVDRSGDIGLI